MPGIKTVLARIKRNLFKKPFLKDKRYPAYWIDLQLKGQPAFLVQIGSNDGKTGDPFYELLQKNKNWDALFVEPVPHTFEQLKFNYKNESRFTFENVAINEGQKMVFYSVDKKAKTKLPDLPYWFDQLGSFDENHILKHFDGALKPFIVPMELEGLTLQTLFDRNNINKIDLLHIDTEGYDWKILSQLNRDKYNPSFILIEHHHLSNEEKIATLNFLKPSYWIFELGIDLLAVNKTQGKPLFSAMNKHMKKVL